MKKCVHTCLACLGSDGVDGVMAHNMGLATRDRKPVETTARAATPKQRAKPGKPKIYKHRKPVVSHLSHFFTFYMCCKTVEKLKPGEKVSGKTTVSDFNRSSQLGLLACYLRDGLPSYIHSHTHVKMRQSSNPGTLHNFDPVFIQQVICRLFDPMRHGMKSLTFRRCTRRQNNPSFQQAHLYGPKNQGRSAGDTQQHSGCRRTNFF
ncbi:hypothetical protein [Paraburkholderia hayleyella]|uniref:hypothetical protein n=1 Tax=Paraburkholderia hayleyella TaxID=2152889 RepID=UPI001292B707|nr:hypothetical protein [Paraburkholderia hayleyella]